MFELEAGAVAVRRDPQRQPADLAAVLPGDREMPRRLALLDHAAGVAMQLISTAEAQLAGDREEPAPDPLGASTGVPEVLGGGGEGTGGDDDLRGRSVAGPRADGAGHGVEMGVEVEGHAYLLGERAAHISGH
jgi:hypothetical protein